MPFGLELRCYRGMRRATSEYCFSPFLTHNGNDADIAFPVLQSLAGHTNPRTTMPASNAQDAHRPLRAEHDLAAILSHVEERVVTHDYTIRYQGKVYQIARRDVRPGLRAGRVRVEQRLDGNVAVRFRQHYLSVTECPSRPPATPPVKPVKSKKARGKAAHRWMEGFNLQKSPPLWAIVKAETSPHPDTG